MTKLDPNTNMPRQNMVLVGMTGGVESTAAAIHGLEKGYDVKGIHLEFSDMSRAETPYVKKVCELLGIELLVYSWHTNEHADKYNQYHVQDAAWYTALLAPIAAQIEPDEVWGGMNINDHIDYSGWFTAMFNAYMSVRDFESQKRHQVIGQWPLIRLTKQQQYDMIPENVRKYLAYCHVNKDIPCGKCIKCEHYNNELENFTHRTESVL